MFPFNQSDLSTNFTFLTCPLHDYLTWSLTSWAPQYRLPTGSLSLAFFWFVPRIFKFRISYLRLTLHQWFIFSSLRFFVLNHNSTAKLILMFTLVRVGFVMILLEMGEPWTAEYFIVLMLLFWMVFMQDNELFTIFLFPLPLKVWQMNHSNTIQLTCSHFTPLRKVNFKTH